MDVIQDTSSPAAAKEHGMGPQQLETGAASSHTSFEECEGAHTESNLKVSDSKVFSLTSSSLCNLLVYTSGESSSSSSDNSDDSDSYECDSDVQEVVVKSSAAEKEKKKVKNGTLLDTLKNLGELSIEDLPPVQDVSSLNIEVKSEECDEIGKISSIVDKLVMVESIPNKPAYNIDTLLFLDKGKQPLGYIFDVIGAVTCPMYAIRFNSTEEIAALNISKGLPVFSAPKSEHTQYVFVQQLLKAKGSDASWKDDLEVPQEHQDFSDDEAEQGRKRSINPDSRKRNSIDRHKNFEKDMNVKNLIDSRLHKIRDNFEPTNKKHTPNNNYKRGYQFQNFRPNLGFSQPTVSSTSCAFPYSMPPFMPSNMPMPQFPPQSMPPFVPNLPPPTANFVSRLPPPLPSPFPMHPYPEMVSPMFPMPPNPPQPSQAKNPEPRSPVKLAVPLSSASPPVLWGARRKTGLHLRNSEESRMPGEGGGAEPGLHRLHRNCYDPEYARMEAWLDEHPDFVQDYFLRKATRQVVDSWLVSHATPTSSSVELSSPTHNQSRGGSGATTPVRKISAHEFERGGLLKPMISTIDGTPTFLTSSAEGQTGSGPGHSPTPGRRQRRSRHELRQLDEKELIFELVKDICNELEVRSLCHKILQNVSTLLHADRGSLFLVQGEKLANCQTPSHPSRGRHLVSKLFDVCSKSTLVEMEKKEEIKIPWGTGIVGYVAESGIPVNIPDAYQDKRFNHDIDVLTGYKTRTLLCMPIKDTNGDVIGVAQVINKVGDAPFTEQDEKIFASYLQFCGIGLRNAHLYEKSQLEVKRNQVLLDLARMIFEEQSTIEHVVFRILTHTQSLIQCQRVQVLLVHQASKGSFSRVFDFEATDLTGDDEPRTSPYESRFPINIGITGYVATTGETVSIPCAYEDARFDPNVDEGTSFKHKTILCMAIKNSSGQIIGVIQLINKFDDLPFTKNDENFVEAFAIFCGMGIHNTHMYERAVVAIAKQSVTLEVLSYHATASLEDAQRLRKMRVPSAANFRLHEFTFDDFHMDDDETITACIRMFLDLDLVERFHMDYEVLCRWLLSVKKNYRNVTYHNWRHAFNVAQMMFSILTATQWWKIFGEAECLALIIGCLCHDLDHRGTNNSFQIKASSPLAQLYSTSTMEHHHFDQCIMILNSPGNQLLANVSPDEYSRVIRIVEEAILSTDLAVYFRKRGAFFNIVSEGPRFNTEEHRELLRAMLMTVCDLAAITKPWDVEKRVAELVSSEFFEQGDIEREELNITPIDIMNREKEDQLPLMQVGFIDSICLPIYESFALLSDKLEPLVDGVKKNRDQWLEIAAAESLIPIESMEKDSNDNMAISKSNSPETEGPNSPVHNFNSVD